MIKSRQPKSNLNLDLTDIETNDNLSHSHSHHHDHARLDLRLSTHVQCRNLCTWYCWWSTFRLNHQPCTYSQLTSTTFNSSEFSDTFVMSFDKKLQIKLGSKLYELKKYTHLVLEKRLTRRSSKSDEFAMKYFVCLASKSRTKIVNVIECYEYERSLVRWLDQISSAVVVRSRDHYYYYSNLCKMGNQLEARIGRLTEYT